MIHLHSHLASHDTFGSIEYNLSEISKLGFKSVASTEHGTLSHVLRLKSSAKENGIKLIIGLEPYITHNNNTYHITLLSKNLEGYKSLIKLNNIAKNRGMHHKKRNASTITMDEILENSEGLILLTGCFNSPFQTEHLDYQLLSQFKNKFQDDFYAEAQLTDKDYRHINRAIEIANYTKSKIVVTNDCHFVKKEHTIFHQQLLGATSGFSYDSSANFFTTREELLDRVGHDKYLYDIVIEGIENTFEVDEKCVEYELSSEPGLPEIPNAEKVLRDLSYNGFEDKKLPVEYKERLETELNVIINGGYASYFLITKDILDSVRNKFKLGYGRGSAAGSLICYCLGITNVDPIKYGLLFERFLNPNRLDMPDIDNDIPSAARKDVLEYTNNKYGALSVAAFDSYSLLSAIIYAKKMKIFDSIADTEWKYIQEEGDEEGERYQEFSKRHPEFDDFFKAVNHQIKNISKHAGGIVLLPDSIKDLIPYEQDVDGNLIVGLSEGQANKDLAKFGGVKFDVLGLTALDILTDLRNLTGIVPPLPGDGDLPELELLRNGKNAGIFQFSGAGINKFTMEVKPRNFEDIVSITSVYRAGTLLGGTGELYKQVKVSGKPRKLNAEIDAILANTDGLIIYQEDVMKLYAWATGKDFSHADFARKTLVKYKKGDAKSEKALAQLHDEMFEGMDAKGVPKNIQKNLWSEITTHSMYSFNRSHAVAYSMITWDLLWYKYHYPLDFYTVCLNYRSDLEKQQFIFDIIDEGYTIKGVDINLSTDKFTNDGKNVYIPLTGVKGVAESAYTEIVDKRPFVSIEDFMERRTKRKINSRILKTLYQVGAFDNLTGDISVLGLDDYDKPNNVNSLFSVKIPTKNIYDKVKRVLSLSHDKQNSYYSGIIIEKKLKGEVVKYVLAPDNQIFYTNKDDPYNDYLQEDNWYSVHIKNKWKQREIYKIVPLDY